MRSSVRPERATACPCASLERETSEVGRVRQGHLELYGEVAQGDEGRVELLGRGDASRGRP